MRGARNDTPVLVLSGAGGGSPIGTVWGRGYMIRDPNGAVPREHGIAEPETGEPQSGADQDRGFAAPSMPKRSFLLSFYVSH